MRIGLVLVAKHASIASVFQIPDAQMILNVIQAKSVEAVDASLQVNADRILNVHHL